MPEKDDRTDPKNDPRNPHKVLNKAQNNTPPDEQPEQNKIYNAPVESIANPYFGNQFMGQFINVPQTGYYADESHFRLRSYYQDRLNESIRGIQLPEFNVPMIAVPYFGMQNNQYPGVGDGELGSLTVRFKLDRYLNTYCAMLNWNFLKWDWSTGISNQQIETELPRDRPQKALEAEFIVEFLDANEDTSRKIAYKMIIDQVPGLSLAVDSPDEIDFECTFKITDMDVSQFVLGSPITHNTRVL
jgi:hypothetical protein